MEEVNKKISVEAPPSEEMKKMEIESPAPEDYYTPKYWITHMNYAVDELMDDLWFVSSALFIFVFHKKI